LKFKLGLAIIVIAATAFALLQSDTPAPPLNVNPIPKNARVLGTPEVSSLLGSQFVLVRKVRLLPVALKQSFTNFTSLQLDMSDPGERIGTDFVVPGVPSRRLVFAGVNGSAAVLVYDQGGYATTRNAVVFSFENGGAAWGAFLNGRSVDDVPTLKMAVEGGRFHTWGKRK
jgi:hypothetical protein